MDGALRLLRESSAVTVAASAVAWTVYRGGFRDLYALLGAVVCTLVNKVLKRVIDEARPSRSLKQGGGMPSSHACALSYWFLTVAVLSRPHLSARSYAALMAVLGVYVAAVVYASVAVTYEHTWQQVAIGLVVGNLFAAIWIRLAPTVEAMVRSGRS